MTHGDLFTFHDVSVRRRNMVVLHGITASVQAGRGTAIVGPSGAGKSTMLRLFTRLERPDSGTVTLDGIPLDGHDVLALRRRVQFVAQRAVVLTDLVLDELRLADPELTEDDALALLADAALPARFLHRPTAGLSGGEAQRLCLARSLAMRPDVLVLDEPTSALDTKAGVAVVRTLRTFVDAGGTAVLVSHDQQVVAALADDTIALRRGTLDTTLSAPTADLGEAS